MARAVPMVRAMCLIPAVRWLEANGRPVEALLRSADLLTAPFGDPLRPVSLFRVGSLLRSIALSEGPDIACRIVAEAGIVELALLGRVALGTRTPKEALFRIASALPLFCSHEQLSFHSVTDGFLICHSYSVRFDAEVEHLMLQYAAAMADRLCAMTGAVAPRLTRVEIPAHPRHGVHHLYPWLGEGVVARQGPALSILIPRDVFQQQFPTIARDRKSGSRPADMIPLRGDGRFSTSAQTMLASMLDDGVPTISQLADTCGTSIRTLQRWLEDDGTSFSALLELIRKDRALQRLSISNDAVVTVASELGYSRQASLTRAMRRWTGSSPTHFRDIQSGSSGSLSAKSADRSH